jgi:hypothetical protein
MVSGFCFEALLEELESDKSRPRERDKRVREIKLKIK